jgi:hypothetical protein
MSESIITLWINSESNSLLPSWNAFGTATIPSIKQGDSAKIEIHWIKSDQSGNFMSEVAMSPTSTLKLAIGSISGVPAEGYFTYNYQGDTVQIPYDADVTSFPPLSPPVGFVYVEKNVNTLINSLPSIIAAGGVVVSIVNQRTLRVVFNNFGVRALSSCDATTLRPSTNVSVTRINIGGASTKEVQHLRPKVLPIAYTDSFFTSPSPVISITDIDSITKRISITPQPKFGTFTISNGTLTTSVLSINSSASDVLSALTSANINSSTRLYSVAKSGDYSWDIYRTSGTAETLTVTDSGMIGFESKFGVIDFNTIEIEDYLGGAEKANATIEVEYSDGTIKQTLYQGTVSIVNDLIEDSVYSPIPFPELNAGIGEAPMDSILYGRKDGIWSAVVGDGNNIPDYNNGITYTVGNQVYFQGKLYRMIIAVGAAGYNPVASPSYWESLSGSNPDLTNYLTKDGGSLNSGAQLDFDNAFGVSSIGPMGAGFYELQGTKNVSIYNNRVDVDDGVGSITTIRSGGITFPDATIQTTAATTPDLSGYAPLASPALTGVPTAPTPLATDNSTTIATTAYVASAVASATTSASTDKVVKTCRNATGSLIPARSVVYINGANGTHPTIQLAQANAESTSYRTFGITSADIANSADGTVVIIGEILNVNTGLFAAGDQLFLSPTIAGGITNVKPSAPDHMVYVGVCTRANTNNGSIEVKVINGFELNELHDVAIASKVDKNLLSYEASTNLWKNKSAATLGIAELSGATFTGKVNTLAPDATSAGINIGSTALFPSTTIAGDMFITNNSLIYKDSSNLQQTVLSGNKANTINLNATISGTNTPLSITQSGQILGAKALSVSGLTTLFNSSSSNANGAVSIFNESSGPALRVTTGNVTTAEVVVIESSNSAGTALRITNTGNSNSLIVEDSANPDTTSFIITNNGKVGIGTSSGFTGGVYKLSIYADAGEAALYLSGQLNTNSGISALGKISCNSYDVNYAPLNLGNACASAPLGAVNGDIWITNAAAPKLAYKTGGVTYYPTVANAFNTFTGGMAITGASVSNPQLQVTQSGAGTAVQITTTGAGNALVVEDEASPDTHSFIVNTSGNVGIGVASGYTPVGKLDVAGSITSTTATAGTDSTVVATTAFVKSAIVPSVTSYTDGLWSPIYVTTWNSIHRLNFTYDQSVQLPTNAQSPAIIGTQVVFLQLGAGRLNFTPTNGNTVMSAGSKYKTNQQYSVVTAIKTGANEWLIAGDLSVS